MTHQTTPDPVPDSTGVSVPAISLNELQTFGRVRLLERARELGIRLRPEGSLHHLVLDQAKFHLGNKEALIAEGVLEMDGQRGILRWPAFDFKPGPEDATVPAPLIRQYQLQAGLKLRGHLRLPQHKEHGLVLDRIDTIEGIPVADWEVPVDFEKLTPLFPNRRILLETNSSEMISARAVDLIAPLGMGQRGLIVAPPRAGKTVLLKELAQAIRKNQPDVHLILLLVDERPEEVTDFRRSIDCDIFSSTFDEPPSRHVQVAELVSERAKRLVELKQDVVILVDSITRMSRGYNNLQPTKGSRTMSGGVDAKALAKPKRFFGAARNVEEGGSLTILATALIETHSRMDDLIFEEYKGTGNMEIHLDRSIAETRVFPAIHILKSATRREEMLYHPDEYARVVALRRQLSEIPAGEAMETLQQNLIHTSSNAELLLAGLKGI
jgi:transcription termination factor Rho